MDFKLKMVKNYFVPQLDILLNLQKNQVINLEPKI